MKIGIIGEGHLGSLLKERLSISRPNVWSINRNRWKIDGSHFVQKMDLLIIAVRPKDLAEVMFCIRANAHDTPVISFVAGIKYEDYKYKNLYRAMTNIGIANGSANSIFMIPPHISETLLDPKLSVKDWDGFTTTQELLFEFGDVSIIHQNNEALIDTHTIIAGSGIAFMAYFQQILHEWAVEQGMPPAMSASVISQVFTAVSEIVIDNVEDFEKFETFDTIENNFGMNPYKTIIDEVATPGGTTAAGIEVMEGLNPLFEVVSSLDGSSKNLKEIIHDALTEAHNKAKQISEDGLN